MAGVEHDDQLQWEGLYYHNISFNTTEWVPWNVSETNRTWGDTSAPFDSPAAVLRAAVKAVILGLLILATVVGKMIFFYTNVSTEYVAIIL